MLCPTEHKNWEINNTNNDPQEQDDEPKIKLKEVIDAINMLKRGKAAGHDQITGEMLKNIGENELQLLNYLFNWVMTEKRLPDDWEIGIILPLFKK